MPFPPKRPTVLVTPARQACAVLGFPSTENGPAPLELRFQAEGDCSEGEAVYTWEFGDGSPHATGDLVLHTYEKPGTYHVFVRVTSTTNATLTDSDDFDVVVEPPDAENPEGGSPE